MGSVAVQPADAGRSPAPVRRGLVFRVVAAVLRAALHIFFRRIEVIGLEKLPAGRPLVLVANHVNGIVDPLLVALVHPTARFLAKSTLWRHPVIAPLLRLTGAIPVYRHQDPGAETQRNGASFAQCHDALAAGEVIALFPEGKSHNAAALAPLKTGAARIVLEAEAKRPGLGVRIVPIGLSFDAKTLFRSRVVVRVGAPIDPSGDQRLHALEPWPAVRRLTQRIGGGLAAVTVNYASWDEARLIARAADLHAAAAGGAAPLADQFAMRLAFAAGYRGALQRHPQRVRALLALVSRYDTALRLLRLRDDQVLAPPRLTPALRRAPRLLAWSPFALAGTAAHWAPYRAIGALTRRLDPEDDIVATYKLFGGLLLFPLWWLAGAITVGAAVGPLAGALSIPVLALCGYAALLFHEARAELWEDTRARGLLWWRGNLAAALARLRAEIALALRELVGEANDLRRSSRSDGTAAAPDR